MDSLAKRDFKDCVYLDESGIDNNETYPFAWTPQGERAYDMKYAERKQRLSIISVLHQNQLKAPFVFEGSCNRSVFVTYLKKVLVPELKPGQTLILDNASFHKGKKIEKVIQDAGCHLLYLPPYSPDLNPIEHHWSGLKHRIRQALPTYDHDLYKTAEHVFHKS